MAFGPLATAAFYLAQVPMAAVAAGAAGATGGSGAVAAAAAATGGIGVAAAASVGSVPAFVWVNSVLVGLTTTVILFCSHFHQIKGDTAAGKRSPLVRLGTEKGCQVRIGRSSRGRDSARTAPLTLL
jgi:1,4-dihydroxy-2-naphthoate octaprenyltransferase